MRGVGRNASHTAVYTSTVADTSGPASGFTSSSNSASLGDSSDTKMERIWLSSGNVKFTVWNREARRCEISERPPPGGAIAAMSCMSRMYFHDCFARSYHPP